MKRQEKTVDAVSHHWPALARQSPDWPFESRKAFRNRKQHGYEFS
jgi:hypothetical protein